MKRTSLMVAALLLAILSSGCGNSGGGSAGPGEVVMTAGQDFDPGAITVAQEEKITFTNDSQEAHTVTAYKESVPEDGEYFASGGFTDEEDARDNVSDGLVKPGESFSLTITEPGTYTYFCIPHESAGMKGTIVVEPLEG